MKRLLVLFVVLTALLAAEEGARLVVICRDDFIPVVQPLVDWRSATGLSTKLVPGSQLGNDTALIHNWLLDAWQNWPTRPEYVLIVAHPAYIRAKIYGYSPATVYSDNYYGDLEGDWQGEIPVGRFPAITRAECSTMVARTLAYEKLPDGDTLWMRRLTTIIRDDYDTDDTIYYNNIRYAATLATAAGFSRVDSFTRRKGQAATNVVASVNTGTGIVLYRGRGVGNWYDPFEVDPNQTANGNRLPIVVSATCATMALDPYDSMVGRQWVTTRAVDALRGAAGFFGNTHSDNNVAPRRGAVTRGFFTGLFVNDLPRLGDCALRAKKQLATEFPDSIGKLDYRGFNLFGDPALPVWSARPRLLQVAHPDTIHLGPQLIDVTVTTGGAPLAGAFVCITMDSSIRDTATTDADGRVSFSVAPADTGRIRVVATGRNLVPYDGGIAVVAASGIAGRETPTPGLLRVAPSTVSAECWMDVTPGAQVAIYSAAGRLVASDARPQGMLARTATGRTFRPTADLPAGVYLVRAALGGTTAHARLVLAR